MKLSLKDTLVEKTALELEQPEEVVDKVIAHQFSSALQAMQEHSEIEISGFGQFSISIKRLGEHIQRNLNTQDAILKRWDDPNPIAHKEKKMESLQKNMAFYRHHQQAYETKRKRPSKNTGGCPKSHPSS